MTTEAPLHRLWYDLRTQSLFEDSFRDDVLEIDRTLEDMIWRVVARYAELSEVSPQLDPQATYAMFDGLFERALLGHLSGDEQAAPLLAERVHWLLPQICPGASSAA